MLSITKTVRKPLITLSILCVLTGLMATGCSSSDAESVAVKPAAVSDSTSEKAKDVQPVPISKAKDVQPISVVSAAAAGEAAHAVEDHSSYPAMTAAEAGEDAFAIENHSDAPGTSSVYEERQRLLNEPTDAELTTQNGVVLPRIIPGMRIWMPYTEARELIINDGWVPDTSHPDVSKNASPDYPEEGECSGSGMGFCIMHFVDAEMNAFRVITGGSGPDVMDWSDVY